MTDASRLASLALLFLTACKPELESGLPPTMPINVGGGSGILGSYFVRDFTPYESIARGLRGSARFVFQINRHPYGSGVLNSFPLGSARIEYAHSVGLTGQGQTIAISDSGFLTTHEAFQGRSITTVAGPGVYSHGTSVASVAAGNSSRMVGVAPGANLILGPYNDQFDLAATADMARTRNAVALNNSWGYTLDVSNTAFNSVFAGADGAAYLTALRRYAAQGVVVFSLNNNEADSKAHLMAALPMIDASFTSGWLAVGNAVPVYDANRIISATRLSSSCLEAAAWCLVADGQWNAADANGTQSYSFNSGASFAAPQVSGALAILAEAFPTLTPHELRLRLLASADNGWFAASGSVELVPGFRHSYNTEFGHGFMDLRAALLPIGPTTMSANNMDMSLEAASLSPGTAVGDAVETALSAVSVNVTDSLESDFGVNGSTFARRTSPLPLSTRIAARPIGQAADPIAGFAEFHGVETELVLSETPITLRVLTPQSGSGSLGLSVSRRIGDEASGLDLGMALARDGGEVFGLGQGAFGDGTVLATVNLGLTAGFGDSAYLRLGAEAGMAQTSGGGLLGQVDTLGINAFSASIGANDLFVGGDALVIGLSTPMTVTSGNARTKIALFGATAAGQATELSIPLAPAVREQVISIGYDMPLSETAGLRLDLAHAVNWGNRRAASETAASMTVTYKF